MRRKAALKRFDEAIVGLCFLCAIEQAVYTRQVQKEYRHGGLQQMPVLIQFISSK